MSHPVITYADAVFAIETLPTLAPRPCATNIRALTIDLIDKLTIVPSEQSADLGFSGSVEKRCGIRTSNQRTTNWPSGGLG